MAALSDRISPSSTALILYQPRADLSTPSLSDRTDIAYRRSLTSELHLAGTIALESRLIQTTSQRFTNYNNVSKYLSSLTEAEFTELLKSATVLGYRSGGEFLTIKIGAIPVFIKRLRLTTTEQHGTSPTQNHFNLPTYYQYGVGSLGFGARREEAAHQITTEWVLHGECENFPLLYHSRTLASSSVQTIPLETIEAMQKEIDINVEHWNDSPAVRERYETLAAAPQDVVVCMEHFPEPLSKWIDAEGHKEEFALEVAHLASEITRISGFMRSRGFIHFDAHCDNILVRNNRLYFADFGLTMSREFDLSPEERAFFERHGDYDRSLAIRSLFLEAIFSLCGPEKGELILDSYLFPGVMTVALPPEIDAIAMRYRPVVVLMHQFLHHLRHDNSKTTEYPEEALAQEWALIDQ